MSRLLLVHGLKRSGNHAFVNWLMGCGSFTFFNNIIPIKPVLRGEKPIPPPVDYEWWLAQRLLKEDRQKPVIASLEDHALTVVPFIRVRCPFAHVLVLRDPVNLFASRIRKARRVDNPAYAREQGPAMQRAIDLWKMHAREFLGRTDLLAAHVGVYFNAWFTNEDYRRDVCTRLGMKFTDRRFARVPSTGGGSSFDRTTFDGDNVRMDVLNRERYLDAADHELLAAVLRDAELQDLAARLLQLPRG
jgi:hypothetical protein